jgi:hypothetical protein
MYRDIKDTVRKIIKYDGYSGFVRGVTPRLLLHMPSVAISWASYEMLKKLLFKE